MHARPCTVCLLLAVLAASSRAQARMQIPERLAKLRLQELEAKQ